MSSNNPVPRIYRGVIDDVIKNVKESFLNEGVDEQVLNELKQLWENKLLQSRSVEFMPPDGNGKVGTTYPHNNPAETVSPVQPGPSQQRQQQAQQPSINKPIKQTQLPTQTPRQTVTSTHIVHSTPTGQVVYVSQHHPTLGNVPMSDAARKATLAFQNPQRLPTRAILQQPIMGVPGQMLQHGQVILQAPHGQAQVYPQFAQRLIYAPAAVAPPPQVVAQTQPATSTDKKQATRIIQVDGTSDCSVTSPENPLLKSSTKAKRRRANTMKRPEIIIQVDGANDSESEEEEEEEDYDNIPVAGIGGAGGDGDLDDELGEEDDPLNSEDDVSDEDPMDLFDTDNVVVCQYDKIARTRNRWKFHLKDGIMNLRMRDYVFHKANGDAEW